MTPAPAERPAATALFVAWVVGGIGLFGYALVGLCAFCQRGCSVFLWAALMACLPFLTWLAAGLGNLRRPH